MPEADPELQQLERILSELVDGQLSQDQFRELERLLEQSVEARRRYRAHMQLHAGLAWSFHQPQLAGRLPLGASFCAPRPVSEKRAGGNGLVGLLVIFAACGVLALGVFVGWRGGVEPNAAARLVAAASSAESNEPAPAEQVVARFVGLAAARFFGELGPAVGSAVEVNNQYALRSGMANLQFETGATAIIEGPAVFQVAAEDRLTLVAGDCSVHVPPAATGFSVFTPLASVVARDVEHRTRLAIHVAEDSQTDVRVIEGSAYALNNDSLAISDETWQARLGFAGNRPDSSAANSLSGLQMDIGDGALRLISGQTCRFGTDADRADDSAGTVSVRYRPNTPDRVVSYRATLSTEGRAEQLTHVSVKRNGQVREYPVEALVPAEVVSFRAESTDFVGGPSLASSRASVIGDGLLTTGVINPGSSPYPLKASPILLSRDDGECVSGEPTDGMAIRFREPVINDGGPDIVLFEIQMMADPIEGDAFHVSPLVFEPGLRSYSITRFDLDMSMPEALEVQRVYFHRLEAKIDSMERFESSSYSTRLLPHAFRALAVGIDLSDLGYAEGAAVAGLYLQDFDVDRHRIDPVFIAGLPALAEN